MIYFEINFLLHRLKRLPGETDAKILMEKQEKQRAGKIKLIFFLLFLN